MRPDDHVADDGSPLAAYLAFPAGDGPLIVHRAIGRPAHLLELGSGPGRVTRVLVALGHRVTAVDDSAAMLDHVTGAERIEADLWSLALHRTFDGVVAASHLINQPGRSMRRQLLEVGRRHLTEGGTMLIERHPPGWLLTATSGTSTAGPVTIDLEVGALDGPVRSATVTYRLAERSWRQRFDAEDVDDTTLADDAAATGFASPTHLDESGTWVALRAT